ncbi:butyrophilin subfamily 2 member A1-like isoform X2 [Gymnodraco acuticeps]|uniref:Butyrophilin subfamily 2 member A1-like isoform X2 n=1 Tax=Gymnodraco acuticeps TaxID=8218 RepID=A0A6P8WG15_GYMAC|nr:butyrophilin subfamily 2 member A1-like isoform X2 [Gymnodraco acuticeps]
MMMLNTDGKPLKTHLGTLSVLVFLLLLTNYCRGQSQLIGSSQPIVANLGDDIILPCYLEPAVNAAGLTLEWTRPDMDPRFVHVMRSGREMVDKKHQLFKGRTSMFTDELKNGNISMKLSNVNFSDRGKYRCFIPELGRQAFVQLVFASGSSSPPVVSLSGLDGQSGGVVLQCESAGWYPEPEVLWLDAEGKLLSAGPPETVRGPYELYTVSSRVTVEKRPSNSFTCRVQHHNTTRTTQTQIHFPDDFFKLQSRSSSIIIGLAVSLAVCILLLAVSFFFLWREHIFKTKRKRSDEDQFLNEGERVQLMKPDAVQMEALKGNVGKKSKKKNQSEQQLLEEQRRRKDAEKEVQTLEEQLQNKKKEVESKQSELQDLHAEKQRSEKELQSLKGDLWNKNRELGRIQRSLNSVSRYDQTSEREEEQKKKAEAEQEVDTLEKELESRQKETDTNITECEVKEAEVQQLQEEVQRMETSLQTLMESINTELERSRAAEASSSSSSRFKQKRSSRNESQEDQKRREEAETEVSILKEKLQNESREIPPSSRPL